MKRKQKRFNTQQSVSHAIDEAKAEFQRLVSDANEKHREADRLFARCNEMLAMGNDCPQRDYLHVNMTAKEKRSEAIKLEKKASRIESAKLPKLKHTLAAIRTDAMPFLDDKSVVLQK